MKIKLTDEQNLAVDKLLSFVLNKAEDYICLQGAAGTGKSTIITHLIDHLPSDIKICFTSPTHKATKVLKSMSVKRGQNIECMTIHSLLGLTMELDMNGKEVLRFGGNKSRFNDYDLVVCDEMSMINSELFDFINKEVNFSSDTQVIFMGDSNQLNPVNESKSPTFDITNVVELTTVVRQKHGNPILDLCTDIRLNLNSGTFTAPLLQTKTNETGGIGVHCMDGNSFFQVISSIFANKDFDNNHDLCRVIAWRNNTVESIGSAIQKIKYPNLTLPFAIGEYTVFSRPMYSISTNIKFSLPETFGWDKVLCPTETECIIENITEILPFEFSLNAQQKSMGMEMQSFYIRRCLVTAKSLDTNTRFNFVIASDKLQLKSLLDYIAGLAKQRLYGITWRTFYAIQRHFTEIRPVYCLTSHKSQASTYENVFVHAKDIFCNPNKEEALRSFYVACSRASENLIIYS